MKISRLPEPLFKVLTRIKSRGFEAYAVGGFVRDSLLLKNPTDFDITTNAKPEEIKKIFEDFKTIDTGIKHGTITLLAFGETFEITTYRTDGAYSDFRRPDSVSFSDSLKSDLLRRDFTVNAMACDEAGRVVDFYGGMGDLEKKIIRCVGDAKTRFREDALRILRALRFSAVLGFEIEKGTEDAVFFCADLLFAVSKERILAETKKLFCGKYAKSVMEKFAPVFKKLFPEIKNYELSVSIMTNVEGDFSAKVAALMYLSGADAAMELLHNLKSDKKIQNAVCLALNAQVPEIFKTGDALKFIYRTGFENAVCAVKTRQCYLECTGDVSGAARCENMLCELFSANENLCKKISDLAVSGKDVSEAFGFTGHAIGEKLEQILFDVFEGKIKNERNAILRNWSDRSEIQ